VSYNTPVEIAEAIRNAGKTKSEIPFFKLLLLGILAGAYISFGANLATKIGSLDVAPGTPGGQFLFGAVFSVGLMLVIIAGAELFTGNNMFCLVSAISGHSKWSGLVYNWTVVYIANFIGSIMLVAIVYYSNYWGIVDPATDAVAITSQGSKALAIAQSKLSLTWEQAFCRAILCNWLVCLAVWIATAAQDIAGKILAVFFPITAFVASGFEHSVANMFFIPMGIAIAQKNPEAASEVLQTTPEALLNLFNYGAFISNNLVPVTLGNIVGGGFFVGIFYWLIFLRKATK